MNKDTYKPEFNHNGEPAGKSIGIDPAPEMTDAERSAQAYHLLTLIEVCARTAREKMSSANQLASMAHAGPSLVLAGTGAMDALNAGQPVPMKQGGPDFKVAAEKHHKISMANAEEMIRLAMTFGKLVGFGE